MKILEYLQKAWLFAAACAFIVALYNFVTLHVFDNHVYFPIICGAFCILLWYNVRGQRRFRETIFGDNANKETKKSDS